MTKERLSKLQKWILINIHKNFNGFMHKHEIYEGYYGLHSKKQRYKYRRYSRSSEYKKARIAAPAIRTSLKSLIKKDLIKMYRYPYHISGWQPLDKKELKEAGYGDIIGLTPKGKEKAKSLLLTFI